ncbi:MAG: phytoene desaturase family protein [Rhizomicrobium sp.]
MRYDAAIIGAGAEGLAAAVTLAQSGLKVIVLERNERPGGRHIVSEFHSGFFASPFCDTCNIPAEIFWTLGLAQQGVLYRPSGPANALWPDRAQRASRRTEAKVSSLVEAALKRAVTNALLPKRSFFPKRVRLSTADWPGREFATASLAGVLAAESRYGDALALDLTDALEGRVAHPDRVGSALHLLAGHGAGTIAGGLQKLTDGMTAAAQAAGAEISCGLEAVDIRRRAGRIESVRLADGSEVAARTVVSTLDLKRTFLSLFAWTELPPELAARAAAFRMSGAAARLVLALDKLPDLPPFADKRLLEEAIHISPSLSDFAGAYAAWHSGTIAETMPLTIRFPSALDPRLCPAGAAIMTVTVSGVPYRLFDGAWTHEKRDALRGCVLRAIERVLPGTTALVRACELLVPPDIEHALNCADGDLGGGEIASDQMLAYRPGFESAPPRTSIEGLYLAGPSTMIGDLGTCVSGVVAARTIVADLKRGWHK